MTEPTEMELVVDAGGSVRCIYGEELDLVSGYGACRWAGAGAV
jgi:hypothetical protein